MYGTEKINLEASWQAQLSAELEKEYMAALRVFLDQEKNTGKQIYPPARQIFHALSCTPFEEVKVVILGQDPYHGPGQAHGLCFSVESDVRTPPSLKNIYKELQSDLGIVPVSHGNLQHWADQGVLLLMQF